MLNTCKNHDCQTYAHEANGHAKSGLCHEGNQDTYHSRLKFDNPQDNPVEIYSEDYHVLIDCGTCLGCLRDKARSWRVRLLHEHMFGNHDSCTCNINYRA